jgi:hypothetical protein
MTKATKPNPSDYGLDANFDVRDFENLYAKEHNKDKEMNYCIPGILAFFVWVRYNELHEWSVFLAIFSLFIVFFPLFFILMMLISSCLSWFVSENNSPSSQIEKNAERYKKAIETWSYWNLETEDGWWKSLRGQEFEIAVYQLFANRGASALLTQASNDGGVDLVIKLSGQEYYVQAKGLSSKVGVAPIREIAGVCSNKDATPVLVAVNGFTNSAIKTAKELSVGLIDCHQLARMARDVRLNNISFVSNF